MNKQDHKALIVRYKENQKKQSNDSLPMTRKEFKALFDYFDSYIGTCKHDFALTESYLSTHGLTVNEALEWLRKNGAGCDCEILLNVEEKFL